MKKLVILLVIAIAVFFGYQKFTSKPAQKPLKLYWFIPDRVRAEPTLFNIYRWAQEGKLPNIKKLMERGAYGYSYPNFPSHTPTNFATLCSRCTRNI